jgi:type I restriction enzyme M protein
MDQDARRRIDNARDVLVGKIPDPKAQVEQITSALIYKFMDDMDKDAQGLGGKPTFFTNGYEKYAWSHILDPRIGGQERLNRYAEALSTMSQNPHLPQLFRTIFKDAFLPYRDPTTLNLFLKEIDGFTYNHSENLGDAYEYLLSILGSQGDAGQFRTPRHIIDFMVCVVDPKKNETMLDPASGTAGFLISSYRHIIEQNRDHQLTPDEKERLAGNLQGYDIAPDMVRIALVNMYLHSFPNPHIYEYDTLTSEERWDEQFDICMANPPFMTPKGGIRPHKHFQIQANRSEVLFVDYIAEHLKSTGRAAVIVPEGIIFQSANAYKALRKMLVGTWGLWAVVSLPAGLFQPYSGVKTSILFLNRVFAKKTEEVLFVKVQNDGFDLGAQRRPIGRNDLPEAQAILQAWLRGDRQENRLAQWITKTKIAEAGNYNLTGERYKEVIVANARWPLVNLGTLVDIDFGARITQRKDAGTAFPVFGGGGESFRTDSFNRKDDDVVVARFALSEACVRRVKGPFFLLDSGFTYHEKTSALYKPYLDWMLLTQQPMVYSCARGHAQKNIEVGQFLALTVPLPPLDVQREIVAEVDGYQRIIDGAKQVIANWEPVIPVDPSWPSEQLGKLCTIRTGKKDVNSGNPEGKYPFFTCAREHTFSDVWSFDCEAILVAGNGDVGAVQYYQGKFEAYQRTYVLSDWANVSGRYLHFYLNGRLKEAVSKQKQGNTMPYIKLGMLSEFQIPLPSFATQQAIVAKIEAEQVLVDGCKKLIQISEGKVKTKLAEVWGSGIGAPVGAQVP